MDYRPIQQQSEEWWALKVGKISGTRFGQLISGRDNMLIDELANEVLDNYIVRDDYQSEDMLFGSENEPIAMDMLEQVTNIKFERGGVIVSDLHPTLHMASPDGIDETRTRIAEVKCTSNGKIQVHRYRTGVDKDKMGQIINYFAISPQIQEVYWGSYCPFRPEKPIVWFKFTRDYVLETKEYVKKPTVTITIQDKVNEGLALLPQLESDLKQLITNIKF